MWIAFLLLLTNTLIAILSQYREKLISPKRIFGKYATESQEKEAAEKRKKKINHLFLGIILTIFLLSVIQLISSDKANTKKEEGYQAQIKELTKYNNNDDSLLKVQVWRNYEYIEVSIENPSYYRVDNVFVNYLNVPYYDTMQMRQNKNEKVHLLTSEESQNMRKEATFPLEGRGYFKFFKWDISKQPPGRKYDFSVDVKWANKCLTYRINFNITDDVHGIEVNTQETLDCYTRKRLSYFQRPKR